jgi:hypothetical protein
LDRLEPQLPDDTLDPLRRAWKTCESLFEQATQEATIAAQIKLASSVTIPGQQGF